MTVTISGVLVNGDGAVVAEAETMIEVVVPQARGRAAQ
jgi:hypothetical protein